VVTDAVCGGVAIQEDWCRVPRLANSGELRRGERMGGSAFISSGVGASVKVTIGETHLMSQL